jgi:ribosomal protein S18 acetylase RimI-like enzyme
LKKPGKKSDGTNSPFKIRAAQEKDLPWIAAVQVKMAWETEGMRLHPATVKRGVKTLFSKPETGKYWLVTEKSGKAVGMCLTLSEWSDWRCREVLWIHSVFVEPEYRSQGVYRRLYAFLKEKIEKSPDYGGLRLYVDKKNVGAQAVYQKLGMTNHHYELYEWMK